MRYWSRLDPVYEHVNGDSRRLCIAIRIPSGKTVHMSVMGQQDSTYRCTYPGGAEKASNKWGKQACKHTLDRVPNHAPVRIRQMQEAEQENA